MESRLITVKVRKQTRRNANVKKGISVILAIIIGVLIQIGSISVAGYVAPNAIHCYPMNAIIGLFIAAFVFAITCFIYVAIYIALDK